MSPYFSQVKHRDFQIEPRLPLTASAAGELVARAGASAAILVEGWSDQAAVETLARRNARDLQADGIVVLPICGIRNFRSFLETLGAHGSGIRLAGLYDAAEEQHVQRNLEWAGWSANLTRASTEALGFFGCEADLEDELIRALGTERVERILEAQGELHSFQRFQRQPDQRGRSHTAQLRRFLGTRAGRKIRYGTLLVEAVELDRVPRALAGVLAHLA